METQSLTAPAPPSFRDDGAFVFHHPPKFRWRRDQALPRQAWDRYSIYLHVPFCRKICTFCTFERKQIRRGAMDAFLEQLWREMEIVRASDDFEAARVHSLYLGGGTASLLPVDAIDRFLDRLSLEFGLSDGIEATLECEPGTKTASELRQAAAAGINRISIGVQAFQDELLKQLNRSHDAAGAVEMVNRAKEADIENIHVDVMYGLPGQTMGMWQETVEGCIALDVKHISMYQLIVFHNELLARKLRGGQSRPIPSQQTIKAMRAFATQAFLDAGFHQYSLSEFARPGFECAYVRTTWDGSDYLGFGPAAYSRCKRWLWENDLSHSAYADKVEAGRRPVGRCIQMSAVECLERDTAFGMCLLGVDRDTVERRAGIGLDELDRELTTLSQGGLIEIDGNRIAITALGLDYPTQIAKQLTAARRSISREE